jgi:glyoxylase-like metal-dependent hydrolase (beta-lactamase superfamily II)
MSTPIDAKEVVALDNVAAGVVGLRIVIVNVFGVREAGGWTLIDAGLYGSAGRIRDWAHTQFGDVPPGQIVLTHAHFDHVGALNQLVDAWDVPVYLHPEEIGYLRGDRAYPAPDPSVGGGLMARMSTLYPRTPAHFAGDIRPLPPDGSIPGLTEWRWLHTPGHSAGHVSLVRERDRTLIVGDAFCTTKQESLLAVATQRPELHGPPAYFTTDWDAARASVQQLAALRPRCVAPGHGRPLAGPGTETALLRLAREFDTLARPAHGRYVANPTRG